MLSAINKINFFNKKSSKLAFIVFIIFTIIAIFINFIANDKPLIAKCKNKYYFPIFKIYPETEFGGYLETEADYLDVDVQKYINNHGWIIWPLIKFSYKTINYNLGEDFPSPPTSENIFGTDDHGRDVFAQIFYGYRISLLFSLLMTIIVLFIGILMGLLQGYLGGYTDILLQRFTEIWLSMPFFFIIIAISYIAKPGFFILLLIISFTSWAKVANMMRFDVLRIRNMDYVLFARALGVSNFKIIIRHILPNALGSVVSYTPFLIAEGLIKLTALDFIGFGLSFNMPSLGVVLEQARGNMSAPWIAISIFTILSYILIMLIFIGNDLRFSSKSKPSSKKK
ncbi:Inner membrane ABC transporter permease protein YejE [Candidatus Xenohaliotis californiensis]|uniref:Inner membrane ABC transporter permease protein YejE n=1 Tax=Candidatus Xenohaliotis californiensis TaxID=84677 RepID=A0ABP0ETV7_9RICK|nr:Inner membrane ABC transporter permease protein YejE [Candidatus Xenohaliotis californiensis]